MSSGRTELTYIRHLSLYPEEMRVTGAWPGNRIVHYEMSRGARKPVFGISDQVRHKPGCTVSEAG